MAVYMISYDLITPGRNYDNLIETIKAFGTWAHPLESQWLIVAENTTCIALRNIFRAHIDANDKLLVLEIPRQNWASVNLPQTIVDWLNAQVS